MKTAEQAVLTLGEISGKMKFIDWENGNEYPQGLDLQSVTIALVNVYGETVKHELIKGTYESLILIEQQTLDNLINLNTNHTRPRLE